MKNEIIEERIKENKEIFSKEELQIITKNNILIKKISLLGVLDSNIVRNT